MNPLIEREFSHVVSVALIGAGVFEIAAFHHWLHGLLIIAFALVLKGW